MPYYMVLATYAPVAVKAMVKHPQDRERSARELFEAGGANVHQFFFCMGADDVMVLVEAPSDQKMMSISMALGASENFSSLSTTKLVTSAEAAKAMHDAQALARGYHAPTAFTGAVVGEASYEE